MNALDTKYRAFVGWPGVRRSWEAATDRMVHADNLDVCGRNVRAYIERGKEAEALAADLLGDLANLGQRGADLERLADLRPDAFKPDDLTPSEWSLLLGTLNGSPIFGEAIGRTWTGYSCWKGGS